MPVPKSVVVQVNVKRLLVVLLIAVPLLALDMFLVLDHSREEFTALTGGYLQTLAENGARQLGYFVRERVVDLETVARNNQLRDAVREANQLSSGRDEQALAGELANLNKAWPSLQATPLLSRVLGGNASLFLREYMTLNPAFARLLVTGRTGRTLAASHKPALYYHGDQAWWINSFRQGQRGRIDITDAHHDPVGRADSIALSAPIPGSTAGEVIGVIRGFVDVERLVAGLGLDLQGQVLVVDRDARIIAASELGVVLNSEDGSLLSLDSILKDQSVGQSLIQEGKREAALVGFASIQLPTSQPEIDWVVIVARNWKVMSAPIEAINLRALASGFLAIFLVAVVAAYFNVHRPENLEPLEELQAEDDQSSTQSGGD